MARVHVVAAVVVQGDRVLSCRRAAGKASAGQWEFPGGKVEPGEDSASALRRELAEELGIDVMPGTVLVRSTTQVGDALIDLECRWATLRGDAPVSSTDHDALRWLRADELAGLDWCAPDLDAVRRLTEGARPDGAWPDGAWPDGAWPEA
jgi:8-oxo-dGTP diphosphatase